MEKRLDLLHSLLYDISRAEKNSELKSILDNYSDIPEIRDSIPMQKILEDVRLIGDELISLRKRIGKDKISVLSEKELEELQEVNRIIDENLFDYHFQPIVNSTDGEIYSFEALMRPKSELCPSPFHIIKYAEIADRMDDIESRTFINVLGILDNKKDIFGDRRVFINSILKAQLNDEDYGTTISLLEKHPGSVVMEMTEQSELNDAELEEVRAVYRNAGVEIAIDDYGTGYSNIQNLLRYMPYYVKIDRSLMTDIHNSKKKRHFVRNIIDFCHENGIIALAEGVETSEELSTVILLGVDLIQGYYTAKPSAQIIDSIPDEIRQEIKRYHEERMDGKKHNIYTAADGERILLDRLEKENYHSVLIGKNGCSNVTVACTPGFDTNIHIEVAGGFNGSIVLENANLSNKKERPCIDIGENCQVKLILLGQNHLKSGGIRVPESSKFTCCGEGSLSIFIDGGGSYAVGNDIDSKHGELTFETGITVDSYAATGVCIGSGLGGKINIIRGKYNFDMHSYIGIGIGALNADTDLDIFASDISMNLSLQTGLAIGSLENNCRFSIAHSALKLYLSGTDVTAIGTVSGEHCKADISEASVLVNIAADNCSSVSALNGSTDLSVSKAAFHVTAKGDNALAIGGFRKDTRLQLSNSDAHINLVTKAEYQNYYDKDHTEISGGRTKVVINEETIFEQ